MSSTRPELRRQSIRVALAATAVVAAVYLAISVAVVLYVTSSLTAQIDARLTRTLDRIVEGPPAVAPFPLPPGERPLGQQRAIWTVLPDGSVLAADLDLELPATYRSVTLPTTAYVQGNEIRVAGATIGPTRVVIGESLEPVSAARATIVLGELLVAPPLLLCVFVGALVIGRRVAAPIEAARQRQLDFTADASHELRTPLAVIEANASLALAHDRDAPWYRRAFEKVDAESKRMRRLLDDLLWLARFDATRAQPRTEPVNLAALAAQATERFAPVAEAKHLRLGLDATSTTVTVSAPAEWLDRLMGVLLDNACKYSPEGGAVTVAVENDGRRVSLTVDDTGPGIPEHERASIFDRFHRAVDGPSGAGLGLAIADAVVRATSGRWHVGTSPGGGTRMTVSWPATPSRRPGNRRAADGSAEAVHRS